MIRDAEFDVVDVHGDMDACAGPDLVSRVLEKAGRAQTVLIDLTDCMFIDVQGVRRLREAHSRARALGSRVVVVLPYAAAPEVRLLLLELTPRLASFPIAANRNTALSARTPQLHGQKDATSRSERLLALRARLWENGRRREELLAERDALLLERSRLLAERRRPVDEGERA